MNLETASDAWRWTALISWCLPALCEPDRGLIGLWCGLAVMVTGICGRCALIHLQED